MNKLLVIFFTAIFLNFSAASTEIPDDMGSWFLSQDSSFQLNKDLLIPANTKTIIISSLRKLVFKTEAVWPYPFPVARKRNTGCSLIVEEASKKGRVMKTSSLLVLEEVEKRNDDVVFTFKAGSIFKRAICSVGARSFSGGTDHYSPMLGQLKGALVSHFEVLQSPAIEVCQ